MQKHITQHKGKTKMKPYVIIVRNKQTACLVMLKQIATIVLLLLIVY